MFTKYNLKKSDLKRSLAKFDRKIVQTGRGLLRNPFHQTTELCQECEISFMSEGNYLF